MAGFLAGTSQKRGPSLQVETMCGSLAPMNRWTFLVTVMFLPASSLVAVEPERLPASVVRKGVEFFFAETARADGSFRPGIDPKYYGMSDSAYSDLAPVAYAVILHKTFGWQLPHEKN